jgi:hypothetical protein
MAESKFTSGPWVAEHAKSFGNTYRIKAGSLVLCAVVSRELIGDEFDLEETKANAELMADAPELLNALRALCECTVPDPEEDRDLTRRVFADAERLLEKHGG